MVMDTSVALPATRSPRGMTRKFWVLLAVGALAYRAAHLRLELDALKAEAEREGGGEVHGAELLDALGTAAEQRLATVREWLPDDAPQDFGDSRDPWTAVDGPTNEQRVRTGGHHGACIVLTTLPPPDHA